MPTDKRRDAFKAISDFRRRSLIALLAQKPINIATILSHFDISHPAVYEHMRMLRECRMLIVTRKAKKKYYTINLKRLDQVTTWVEKLKKKKSKK